MRDGVKMRFEVVQLGITLRLAHCIAKRPSLACNLTLEIIIVSCKLDIIGLNTSLHHVTIFGIILVKLRTLPYLSHVSCRFYHLQDQLSGQQLGTD